MVSRFEDSVRPWTSGVLAGASFFALVQAGPVIARDDAGTATDAAAPDSAIEIAQGEPIYAFDMASKPLPEAMIDFSAVTGLEVLYTEPAPFGQTAPALKGTLTAHQALERLTAGSGLRYRYTSANTITLQREVAQEVAQKDGEPMRLGPVTVTAARFATPVSDVPTAITVIGRDEIESNPVFGGNIQNGLSQSIPGATLNEVGYSDILIRGRAVSYRINGVEINQRGRGSDVALQDLSSSAFDSIEVVRGADSTFGFGFNGGAINFRTPQPTAGGPQFTSLVGIDFQTKDFNDSLGYRLRQEVSGTQGRFAYAISGGGRFSGTQFDPDGDPYPDTRSINRTNADVFNVNTTFTFALDDVQSLETTQYYFQAGNDPKFKPDKPGNVAADRKATSRPATGSRFDKIKRYQYVSTYSYRHDNLWGNRLDLTGFYQNNDSKLSINRPRIAVGTYDEGNERYGLRSSIETPVRILDDTLLGGVAAIWGVDYQDYEYQRSAIRGPKPRAQIFPKVEEQLVAGHFQLRFPVGDRVDLTAGLRHERGKATLGDITEKRPSGKKTPFKDGKVDFDTTLYNAGLTFHLTDALNAYGSFSQSAGVLDLGRGSVRVDRAADLEPELDPTDQFEVGLRGDFERWQFTAAAFYSQSELGQSFELDPSGNVGVPVPRPRKNWGVELTSDTQPLEALRIGGAFSFNDGQEKLADGTTVAQSHVFNIQPPKLTGYLDYKPFRWWRNRLTVTHQFASGEQNDRVGAGLSGGAALDAKTFVNYFARFKPDFVPGEINLGIENLFNTREFDVVAQGTPRNEKFYLYPARRFHLSYLLKW